MSTVSTSAATQENTDFLLSAEGTTRALVEPITSVVSETTESYPVSEEITESTSLGLNNESISWSHNYPASIVTRESTDSDLTSDSALYPNITLNWETSGFERWVEDFNLQVKFILLCAWRKCEWHNCIVRPLYNTMSPTLRITVFQYVSFFVLMYDLYV